MAIAEGGPLAWLDALLAMRNERLEEEVRVAQEQARAAESERDAATAALHAAEDEAALVRAERERAEAQCRALEEDQLWSRRRLAALEKELSAASARAAEAKADRTWDLIRVLEAALDECRREHGGAHA